MLDVKPPIGLVPEQISEDDHNRRRVAEIVAAISRYNAAGKPVPPEWIDELSRRTNG